MNPSGVAGGADSGLRGACAQRPVEWGPSDLGGVALIRGPCGDAWFPRGEQGGERTETHPQVRSRVGTFPPRLPWQFLGAGGGGRIWTMPPAPPRVGARICNSGGVGFGWGLGVWGHGRIRMGPWDSGGGGGQDPAGPCCVPLSPQAIGIFCRCG